MEKYPNQTQRVISIPLTLVHILSSFRLKPPFLPFYSERTRLETIHEFHLLDSRTTHLWFRRSHTLPLGTSQPSLCKPQKTRRPLDRSSETSQPCSLESGWEVHCIGWVRQCCQTLGWEDWEIYREFERSCCGGLSG